MQRGDGRVGVAVDQVVERSRVGRQRRLGGLHAGGIGEVGDQPLVGGRPRRCRRVQRERQRARVRQHQQRRRPAVEQRPALQPQREGQRRRHDEVDAGEGRQHLVVPHQVALPEPILQHVGGHMAEEEELLGVQVRRVVGTRMHDVRQSATLLVPHDQEHEGDEIEHEPPAPPDHERGGEQHEQVAVGRQRQPEGEQLRAQGDGEGDARRAPPWRGRCRLVAAPSAGRRRRLPARGDRTPAVRPHPPDRRRGRLRRGRPAVGRRRPALRSGLGRSPARAAAGLSGDPASRRGLHLGDPAGRGGGGRAGRAGHDGPHGPDRGQDTCDLGRTAPGDARRVAADRVVHALRRAAGVAAGGALAAGVRGLPARGAAAVAGRMRAADGLCRDDEAVGIRRRPGGGRVPADHPQPLGAGAVGCDRGSPRCCPSAWRCCRRRAPRTGGMRWSPTAARATRSCRDRPATG